jgi:hypothetical protein
MDTLVPLGFFPVGFIELTTLEAEQLSRLKKALWLQTPLKHLATMNWTILNEL